MPAAVNVLIKVKITIEKLDINTNVFDCNFILVYASQLLIEKVKSTTETLKRFLGIFKKRVTLQK